MFSNTQGDGTARQTFWETKEFVCDSHSTHFSFADKLKSSYKFDLVNHFNSIAELTHLFNKSGIDQWFLNLTDYLILLCWNPIPQMYSGTLWFSGRMVRSRTPYLIHFRRCDSLGIVKLAQMFLTADGRHSSLGERKIARFCFPWKDFQHCWEWTKSPSRQVFQL